jgi:hypothetical protein
MPGTMVETYTVPLSEYDSSQPSGCSTSMAGCTGTLVNGALHGVEGTITVIDDCTYMIEGWQFNGQGPAVEWWCAKQEGDAGVFPYPANAKKIGELGEPGSYQLGARMTLSYCVSCCCKTASLSDYEDSLTYMHAQYSTHV